MGSKQAQLWDQPRLLRALPSRALEAPKDGEAQVLWATCSNAWLASG